MIVAAAIYRNGKLWTLPKPANHSDIVRLIFAEEDAPAVNVPEYGFLDSEKGFVTRLEAADIAFQCGQVPEQYNRLNCEDLW